MASRVTADGDDGPSTNDLEDGSKPSVEVGETVETTKPNEGLQPGVILPLVGNPGNPK